MDKFFVYVYVQQLSQCNSIGYIIKRTDLLKKQKRVTCERIWCRRALYFPLYFFLLWMVSLNMKLFSQKRERTPALFLWPHCAAKVPVAKTVGRQGTWGSPPPPSHTTVGFLLGSWGHTGLQAKYLWLHTVVNRQSICGCTLLTGKESVAAQCWVQGKVPVATLLADKVQYCGPHCWQARYLWPHYWQARYLWPHCWQARYLWPHCWQVRYLWPHYWQARYLWSHCWQARYLWPHCWQARYLWPHCWQVRYLWPHYWQARYLWPHCWQAKHSRW